MNMILVEFNNDMSRLYDVIFIIRMIIDYIQVHYHVESKI